ncbi:MAG: esterase/lipase family protein [Candidatus Heimdallarchaeota archaeon]|nr:MAG: hypothetical protein DRP02_04320 [Candidatus Gerdarchaeota archaeon]
MNTELRLQVLNNSAFPALSIADLTFFAPPQRANPSILAMNTVLSKLKKKQASASNRVLIIVPGYSVSTPPKIGDHRFYINKLKFHQKTNPKGYRKIFLFDIYSKKDGRCNFQYDIPALAEILYHTLTASNSDWEISEDKTIDFIGASMGGLIVRELLRRHLRGANLLENSKGRSLKIGTIVLIGTPNRGSKIVDYLQAPFLQFFLKIRYGKNHFAKSEQFRQIAVGNTNIFGPLLGKFFKKKTPNNDFLLTLNGSIQTPGTIRWITIRGTKRKWYAPFLFGNELNDGVIAANSVPLCGAENIADYNLPFNIAWDHRDLYEDEGFCNFLYGLLILQLSLVDYLEISNLIITSSQSLPKRAFLIQKQRQPANSLINLMLLSKKKQKDSFKCQTLN